MTVLGVQLGDVVRHLYILDEEFVGVVEALFNVNEYPLDARYVNVDTSG